MRPGFLLGEIGNGLRRNVSMVVSVVLVTMVSLFFLGIGLLALVIGHVATGSEHRPCERPHPVQRDHRHPVGADHDLR